MLISDALLENLPPEHVYAVFGHEAGHILSHHLAYCAIFVLGTAMLANAAAAELSLYVGDQWAVLAAVAVLAAMWWLAFGRISRAFERQSDVIGAWLAGGELAGGQLGQTVTPEGAALFAQGRSSG